MYVRHSCYKGSLHITDNNTLLSEEYPYHQGNLVQGIIEYDFECQCANEAKQQHLSTFAIKGRLIAVLYKSSFDRNSNELELSTYKNKNKEENLTRTTKPLFFVPT